MKKSFIPIPIFLVLSFLFASCGSFSPGSSDQGMTPDSEVEPEKNETEVSETEMESADVVFTNGTILSMVPGEDIHQGIAIKGNRILALGEVSEMNLFITDSTQVIDLEGRTLMPGFVDAHQYLFDDGIIDGYNPLPNQQVAIESGITSIADLYVDQNVLDHLVEMSNDGQIRVRLSAYLVHTDNCGNVISD